jgi:hypothetical protein
MNVINPPIVYSVETPEATPNVIRQGVLRVVTGAYQVVKMEPVAARVLGAGTSSVVPGGVAGIDLPEAAILVSPVETSTGL